MGSGVGIVGLHERNLVDALGGRVSQQVLDDAQLRLPIRQDRLHQVHEVQVAVGFHLRMLQAEQLAEQPVDQRNHRRNGGGRLLDDHHRHIERVEHVGQIAFTLGGLGGEQVVLQGHRQEAGAVVEQFAVEIRPRRGRSLRRAVAFQQEQPTDGPADREK